MYPISNDLSRVTLTLSLQQIRRAGPTLYNQVQIRYIPLVFGAKDPAPVRVIYSCQN